MNKKSEPRCQGNILCLTNINNKDCNKILKDFSAEKLSNNEKRHHSSLKRNSNHAVDVIGTYKESIKTSTKDENKPIYCSDVKITDKKPLNNYTTNILHNTIEQATILKKCICYTNYCGDNLIKNKVCTICNRYVDNVNTCDNSIKKKYQQELTRHRYIIFE